MAIDLSSQEVSQLNAESRARTISASSEIARILLPLASLRLTVALLAMAIFLIFAGTLAQVDKDIWEVMTLYFRTYFAWIPFQVFFPPSFFGGQAPDIPGGFWFPGGWLIGGGMFANLLAAHALRFKVQARGSRLAAGLATIAIGIALTWLVVAGGSGKETIEGAAPIEWSAMWTVLKLCLVGLWLSGAFAFSRLSPARKIERAALLVGEFVLGGLLVFLFLYGESSQLGDSSMRILWQLIKGGLAGLVLLAGCWLAFGKRAGIVLLHSGVALVMANELLVTNLHVEGQMQIREGETVNYAHDIRTIELAVVDGSDAKTDDVVAVPRALLLGNKPIHDPNLPFDVQVVKFLPNSRVAALAPGEVNLATAGIGLNARAVDVRAGAGTDAGGKVDVSAAYVKLTNKKTSADIGTYLVRVELPPQPVTVGDKTYDLSLRFKRNYKPYMVRLDDFRFDKYLGTETPKNYSSDIRLVDASRGVDRDVHIWMNNPLRFGGETFYQSSFFVDDGREGTVLQVVTNAGWMIPYVACMLVATGMLAQFSSTLVRFQKRRAADEIAVASRPQRRAAPIGAAVNGAMARWFPAAVVLVGVVSIASMARPPRAPLSEMQYDEFGQLPVVYEGRAKPIDTMARNMLRYLSGKQTYTDESGTKPAARQPATRWLLDVIARPAIGVKHKVFRIENTELLETLGLARREGFRYAIAEFVDKLEELKRQARLASSLEPAQMSAYQKKVLELEKKLQLWEMVCMSFDVPEIKPDSIEADVNAALARLDALSRMQTPLAIPPETETGPWRTLSAGWFDSLRARAQGQTANPATLSYLGLLSSYAGGETETFNSRLANYQTYLDDRQIEGFNPRKISFEAFFNTFEPFYGALVLYVAAFVLVALSWLGWSGPFNKAAFWLIVLALAVHTFALIARIYISGRPPVTNLYSSAVFIGWGGVVLGLILELIFRLGIGNVIASVLGFTTLLIANFLAGLTDGDTMGVLQAVLDTQFWLATHVVCVTLGYATTFIAGALGILYILRGVLTSSLNQDVGKDLSRMIYGTVCFAMFFSFVGTVLGGLWADDSWGRFWGWDPKENGALIIVLWNALVLHARWGGMVRERGLAALAVGGNIVTSWSWFGVNELGVGLHSYGFTEGVLKLLGIFIATQLAVIALAMLPADMWLSRRKPEGA